MPQVLRLRLVISLSLLENFITLDTIRAAVPSWQCSLVWLDCSISEIINTMCSPHSNYFLRRGHLNGTILLSNWKCEVSVA